ncbi:MAG: carbohydrate ABC transporter permease [Clostridia bacterium]|nr:carbohydrate ABC transporter permease [Clostridia bacterium]
MDNIETKPKITKETKNKIKVEFDRTPLKERMKAKFLNLYFLGNVIWYIFRLVLLIGVSYIVLYPFLTKIAGSFMSPDDFVDVTVRLIPKNFTLDTYKAVLTELGYFEAFGNTLLLSLSSAFIQTFVCCLIGYGLAKFRFSGNKLVFLLVVLTMVIPHQTIQLAMFMHFRYFDVWGILSLLSGGASVGVEAIDAILGNIHILDLPEHSVKLLDSFGPMIILSATGLGFKNGLYIFMLRQFFTGVPDALEESAYIDGSGVFRTFFTIILPLSIPMMVTVFLFAFCWQWTDDFYTNLFFTDPDFMLMPNIVEIPPSLETDYPGQNMYYAAIKNTCGICIIAPLVILYLFCQKFLVQGIERSGLTAD